MLYLLQKLVRRAPRRKPTPPRRFRPALESLEVRLTPADVRWIGSADGNWSNPRNWRVTGEVDPRLPQAGDHLIFDGQAERSCETDSAIYPTEFARLTIDGFNGGLLAAIDLTFTSGLSVIKSGQITGTAVGGAGAGGTLHFKDTLEWSGGYVGNKATLQVEWRALGTITGSPRIDDGGRYRNEGVTRLATNLSVSTDGKLENNGTFDLRANGNVTKNFGSAGSFKNLGGTLTKVQGTGVTTVEIPFTNQSSFFLQSGTTVRFTDSAVQTGSLAATTLEADATLTTLTEYLVQDGDFRSTGAGTKVSGNLKIEGGKLDISAAAGVPDLTVTNAFTMTGGEATIRGKLAVPNNLLLLAGGTMKVYSEGDTTNLDASSLEIRSGAALYGFNGRVRVTATAMTNAGTIWLHDDTKLGYMEVTGSYTQTSTGVLKVALGGANVGQYSQLRVTGHVNFGGTLEVTYHNFLPMMGQNFQIVTYGSHGGTFATISRPAPGMGRWVDDYGATAFSMRVAM